MSQLKSKSLSELAQRIRNARKQSHLSQAALAKGIGVSDKSISSYEKARSIPPFVKLKKIAEQTHHPISYFMNEDSGEAEISQKLTSIERELLEVKRLLRNAKK